MNVRLVLGFAAFSLVACGGTEDGTGPIDGDPSSVRDDVTPNTCPVIGDRADEALVRLATEDGLMLEADLYTTGAARGPVAVLLHSNPETHDRRDYPRAFIDALLERGISVLNVDRRGAGGSSGEPRDAYQGTKGVLDAKATFTFLTNHSCDFSRDRIVFVGIENGTTSVLDFAVMAAKDTSVAMPRALVFISGGNYTENNVRFSENRAKLDAIPALFLYSPQDRSWISPLKSRPSRLWNFRETERGSGADMFAAPQTIGIVANFVRAKAG